MQLALSIRVTIAAVAVALHLRNFSTLRCHCGRCDGHHRDADERRTVLKATFDYLVGTLGGAIYGGAIRLLVPHSNEITLLAVLGIAVAPLAFLAARNPKFSVAPVTAIIVLLVPTITHASQIASAVDRVLEITVGGVIGLAVSFFLLPSNAGCAPS